MAAPETSRMPARTVPATPEQQRVLERIALQRQRLRERRALAAQAAAAPGPADADAPLLRAVDFARAHPSVVVGAVGVALWLGPRRLLRWAGTLLPLWIKLRSPRGR